MTVKKVWIEEGCIACSLCQDYCPEVFLVQSGDTCVVRPDAAAFFSTKEEQIRDAALDCPVEVIKHDPT
jgi:ferredoxin